MNKEERAEEKWEKEQYVQKREDRAYISGMINGLTRAMQLIAEGQQADIPKIIKALEEI